MNLCSVAQITNLCLNNLPFDLNWFPKSVYLVGGAVRDALLGISREYLDLDFVLPDNAIAIARQLASNYQAGFVVLDPQREIARVVFKQGTVDIASQEGESIAVDLQRRDFTINAIAFNLHTQTLIDPLEGRKDLCAGVLRMISPNNLEDDPLRLLRAYRQGAQLNFTIEAHTRATIRRIAPLLKQVAAERVRTELNYLLAHAQGNNWLRAAWEDGLLPMYLKNVTLDKLTQLEQVEQVNKIWSQLGALECVLMPKWYSLAKLACLVSSDAAVAESELMDLKYARHEIKSIVKAIACLSNLKNVTTAINTREQYFLFLELGKVFPLFAYYAIASGVSLEIMLPLMKRYLDPNDLIAHPQPLVTGNDLIQHLQLKPSPEIGKLLTEIAIAHSSGQISTPEEAIALASTLE